MVGARFKLKSDSRTVYFTALSYTFVKGDFCLVFTHVLSMVFELFKMDSFFFSNSMFIYPSWLLFFTKGICIPGAYTIQWCWKQMVHKYAVRHRESKLKENFADTKDDMIWKSFESSGIDLDPIPSGLLRIPHDFIPSLRYSILVESTSCSIFLGIESWLYQLCDFREVTSPVCARVHVTIKRR